MKNAIKKVICFSKWFYVKILGWIFYDKKYLTGRWFDDGIYSPGWLWAANDIHSRIHTLKNLGCRWPVAPTMNVGSNIEFDPDDLNNMQGNGCYFQTMGGKNKIVIGRGTYIANNVGIITSNHDIMDLDNHVEGKDVNIGEKCWIGMNSVILPGVTLGDHTVVGAGSIVTKSFSDGYCVIVGNPAKMVKTIEKRWNCESNRDA